MGMLKLGRVDARETPRTKCSRERGFGALKFSLPKLMSRHPDIWAHSLREKRAIQEAEEAAVARIRKHWQDQGIGLYSRCGMTHKGWQTNINLTSHNWSKQLMDFERVLLPGGIPMCLHSSSGSIIKEREKIAEGLGISSKDDKVSTIFDVIKSLQCWLEYLESMGVLTPCVDDPDYCLLVQLLADALQILGRRTPTPRQCA